jgi:hypothetical protein
MLRKMILAGITLALCSAFSQTGAKGLADFNLDDVKFEYLALWFDPAEVSIDGLYPGSPEKGGGSMAVKVLMRTTYKGQSSETVRNVTSIAKITSDNPFGYPVDRDTITKECIEVSFLHVFVESAVNNLTATYGGLTANGKITIRGKAN